MTNGVDASGCNCSYGTGLFDFNSGTHVAPSTIFNVATDCSFVLGNAVHEPELYVDNILDKKYS